MTSGQILVSVLGLEAPGMPFSAVSRGLPEMIMVDSSLCDTDLP